MNKIISRKQLQLLIMYNI